MHTDHKELAEGDVWEDAVGLVLAAGDARLLPEVRELLEERPAGSEVQHILPGQRVVQEWVVHVGEEPGATDRHSRVNPSGTGGAVLSSRGQHQQPHADPRDEVSIYLTDCVNGVGLELRMRASVGVCSPVTSRLDVLPPRGNQSFQAAETKESMIKAESENR